MANRPCKVHQLQRMLQRAVENVHWTYSVFWQFSPQKGILTWGDGYYNGSIKTRKTVESTEVSTEEATLQRSQQLRELYESLSAAGEPISQPPRRPSAALSPEDLTESEWFYLMCISFSFPLGVGLPGKSYAKRQHIWITRASDVDSRLFSRAILAKSANIQTVVCIPLLGGVVELGTTERMEEDITTVENIKSFFFITNNIQNTNLPALSEQSTSNPNAYPNDHHHHHLPIEMLIQSSSSLAPRPQIGKVNIDDDDDDDDGDGHECDENKLESDETITGSGDLRQLLTMAHPIISTTKEGITSYGADEIMQVDLSEDVRRLSSSEVDWSNNDDNFDRDKIHTTQEQCLYLRDDEQSPHRCCWEMKDPISSSSNLQSSHSIGLPSFAELIADDDAHYSQTISNILGNQQSIINNDWPPKSSSSTSATTVTLTTTTASAFSKWTSTTTTNHRHILLDGASQWALKHILFTVPHLHTKKADHVHHHRHSKTDVATTLKAQHGTAITTEPHHQEASHVLAERKRREKLTKRFTVLRSLVPFVTKMDKASILGDTIEYLKHLRKRIQELESENRSMMMTMVSDHRYNGKGKKVVVEGGGGGDGAAEKVMVSTVVEVSIIESDALVEIQCLNREGLLLEIMQALRGFMIEVTTVQSSISKNGVFAAELRAKVKGNGGGKKASIIEVKGAIKQILCRQ